MIVVVAEMFIGSDQGLGHRIIEGEQILNVRDMYASIIVAGILGYLLNFGFMLIENALTPSRKVGGKRAASPTGRTRLLQFHQIAAGDDLTVEIALRPGAPGRIVEPRRRARSARARGS